MMTETNYLFNIASTCYYIKWLSWFVTKLVRTSTLGFLSNGIDMAKLSTLSIEIITYEVYPNIASQNLDMN
jgi:hypothetical protein